MRNVKPFPKLASRVFSSPDCVDAVLGAIASGFNMSVYPENTIMPVFPCNKKSTANGRLTVQPANFEVTRVCNFSMHFSFLLSPVRVYSTQR